MTKEIPLTRGCVALVDDADFELLSQWNWYARTGDKDADGAERFYATRSQHTPLPDGGRVQKPIHMHRLILDAPDGMVVDHINGNTLDNRRSNLRACSIAENIRNMKKSGRPLTSPFKGVSWHKGRKRWQATIKVNYVAYHLGLFDDIVSAALAYNEAAKRFHGEYARLNPVEAA